jgi:hypothetical protein
VIGSAHAPGFPEGNIGDKSGIANQNQPDNKSNKEDEDKGTPHVFSGILAEIIGTRNYQMKINNELEHAFGGKFTHPIYPVIPTPGQVSAIQTGYTTASLTGAALIISTSGTQSG